MSTADNTPIWARPEPSGRKPRFTRDQIAAAALHIADTEGFEAVTMKRIAAELGSGTMTLYYYVRNKSDIVALMQDAILADQLVPDAELRAGWRPATAAIARRTRAVLMAHPWSPTALTDATFGPNAMRHMEQNLAALATTSLTRQRKLELIAAVDAYVFGVSLQAIETLSRADAAEADPEFAAAAVEFGIGLLRTGEFPQLSALNDEAPEGDSAAPPMTADALTEQFERGLDALLDGLAARLSIA
ncbi:TetR/AcrR family transcriptional regulator [Nocardia sp. NEAU-G5]|uniref:TetR/AcrR family transcriptional regulator n=1 Tax=Nocardia albiluteola TaxID=2842303 RepID=A0ABS6B994_9NOCA|nr:TetR/AcrR family transcriptional regulator [Nocardia albiluteola]MBU3066873.1 TetR/AcrR family transcriptional regulator [Nocardia albiluteola]